jgi:6,7-dimethyl-8-ribityllumazine synthase
MATEIHGQLTRHEAGRFGIVVSRYNDFVTSRLLAGATDALRRHGVADENVTICWVPGAWELGLAAREMAASGRFDAVICLGAVIRGETTHHEHVGAAAARTIADAAMQSGVPVAFGVLTTETVQQAVERAGSKSGNKGEEAALAALEMVSVLGQIRVAGRKK